MKNLDDIIKKSLLNMKYDSKKTLFENKILLSEEETKSELSWDGSSFDLSINATNVQYNTDCTYGEFSPIRQEFCELVINKKFSGLPYKTVDECYELLTKKVESLCKVGGVNYFEFGNNKFTPCLRYHDGKTPFKELVKFSGYFDKTVGSPKKGACGSLQYFPEMFEKKDDKVKQQNTNNQDATPNVKTNVIDTKKQSSGESSNSPSSLNVIVIDDL